jgi:nondiscriminating glutamyl-tRNA synthetase
MTHSSVRVRFAPAPTGIMHIGNVRTALLNYIFAKKYAGTFVVRVEDTDTERNFDPGAKIILSDLSWLGITYDEGPCKEGEFAPYFQSERDPIYKKNLEKLINSGDVYRCFCTTEILEEKRNRSIALKLPPRYDRTCLQYSENLINQLLSKKTPFIWRFKIDSNSSICFTDLARGTLTFDLKNFSDFAVTRQDGSFTFLFANAVDDIVMKISHILRGEDHLSNTANQIVMFHAFKAEVPTYWHLPIITNPNGKKLSKRDFGFSLHDLRNSGFLPEALVNYLGIIGSSYQNEIMNMEQLVTHFDAAHIKSHGSVHYDMDKLRWINSQWITIYTAEQLLPYIALFLHDAYPEVKNLGREKLLQLITLVKPELTTTQESIAKLQFYFSEPAITKDFFFNHISESDLMKIVDCMQKEISIYTDSETFLTHLKVIAKQNAIATKSLFTFLRLALTGTTHGLMINDLLSVLDKKTVQKRIETAIRLLV